MTRKTKKTVSDDISFLLSNECGNLVNPDEDINSESQARVVDEDELDEDLSDKEVAPSKLRQKNVALLDSIDRKYRGGVTSRKDLKDSDSDFENDESDDDNSDASNDGEPDDFDNEEPSGDDDDGDLGDSEDEAIADLKRKGSESFVSYTDFSSGEGDESGDDTGDDANETGDDTGDDANETESGEGMDSEDENKDGGIQHFTTKDTSLEVKKGQAVRNQLSVWDTLMECRIQMQKLVSFSNQLPQANTMPIFRSRGGSSFTSALSKTENNVFKLFELLLNLQGDLLKQFLETKDLSKTTAKLKIASDDGMDEEIPSSDDEKEDEEPAGDDNAGSDAGSDADLGSDGEDDEDVAEELNGNVGSESDDDGSQQKRKIQANKTTNEGRPHKRRKLNDYSYLLAKNHKEFAPYLNSTIQKWNTKTQVAVGRAGSKNFSAFEQSTLKQIEHILADKLRLIRRTQLRRSDFKVLGQMKEENDSSETPKEDRTVPDVPLQEDEKIATEANKEYDPEIFDDTDFYHQLLRELIEKKTADVTDPVQLGRQWIELQKMRSKMKRKVDVKASKGRRLRYSVHPKLVNFMAPQPDLAWSDEAKNELYGSLFGQRKA